MSHRFYNRFIRPISTDSDLAEREVVLNYLLVGTLALAVIAFAGTFIEPLVIPAEPPHPARLAGNLITILFVIGLYFVARYRGYHKVVATILTLMVAAFGCFIALQWGILDPYCVSLLSLSIVMAGVLIGARYSLYITCVLAVMLAYIQHGQATGFLHPDLSWSGTNTAPAVAGDVVAISTILFLIALVSWLFNRQMEMSLRRARRSERALQRQKDLLEIKVQKRTQQLEAARLEQMGELYRFAELGRLSTALFHDLANHLTNISVDIEGLKDKDRSGIIQRMHENVRHIDGVVKRVRQQIQGKSSTEVFNVMDEVNEVMQILSFDAAQKGVSFTIDPGNVRQSLRYKGDLTRFRQVLLNLMSNAMQAYDDKSGRKQSKTVAIRLDRHNTDLLISVTDHGSAIPDRNMDRIFEPFYTTKPKGVGIGLFIVKRVVENDFKGSIDVNSDKREGTTFSIKLPGSYYARPPRG